MANHYLFKFVRVPLAWFMNCTAGEHARGRELLGCGEHLVNEDEELA